MFIYKVIENKMLFICVLGVVLLVLLMVFQQHINIFSTKNELLDCGMK
jgi:hypothetical protein